jgi:hypothetical protein
MSRYIAYYKIQPDFEEAPQNMNAQVFFSEDRPVEILSAESVDEVYSRMQGDVWSPNGEMRDFIRILGLSHTSMSVGDVIYSEKLDAFFAVCRFGFEILTLTN